jgi:tRNA/tmRNA/rRNA uracil-C5-methylase (TrmA/RlmC/RlmD family)
MGWQVDAVEPSPHAADAWSPLPNGIQFHAMGAQEFDWPCAPELVVLDPPRSGMKSEWMERCLAAAPQRIIAVHCGQAAAKRDLTLLRESGYKPKCATLINLFPGSPHGELMSLWERP